MILGIVMIHGSRKRIRPDHKPHKTQETVWCARVAHLEDGVGGAGDGDDALGAGAVADVYLGPALLADVVDDLAALPDDRPHLAARGEAAQRQVDAGHVARQLELRGRRRVHAHLGSC